MKSRDEARSTEKVFGIGLSKTGTTSLYVALAHLGYRSGTFGHMRQLGLEDWMAGDFSYDYLKNYDAVTDLPIGTFFPALDARYPDSRFILTTRDLDSWLASCESQFSRNLNPDPFTRDVRIGAYGVIGFNEEMYRSAYAGHRRTVASYFDNRPGDLLIMDIISGEGWPELCSFLGKEEPNIEFPNAKPGYRIMEKGEL